MSEDHGFGFWFCSSAVFSLLMFQGVGFLHLKLPLLLNHFVKANK